MENKVYVEIMVLAYLGLGLIFWGGGVRFPASLVHAAPCLLGGGGGGGDVN